MQYFKQKTHWTIELLTIEPQNNNLNYLIDPTFTNVNRLFVLSYTRTNAGDDRDSFPDYYVPNVEIKEFNVLIDRKSLFDLPVKNEEEAYEKIIKMITSCVIIIKIMITQLVIYWILVIWKKLQINCNWFE